MPELPEVETIRRYVDATSLHQTIENVVINDSRILEGISSKDLGESISGLQFQSTSRHGKLLFIKLEDDLWLTVHLGMTGWMYYFQNVSNKPAYDRLIITFSNENHLAYSDQRMFGRIGLTVDPKLLVMEKRIGPDVLDLDLIAFLGLIRKKRGIIKNTLLGQHTMAGLGNLYSDEALFQAGICPCAKIANLDGDRLEGLFNSIQTVLKTVISNRADLSSLSDSFLLKYRHPAGICPYDKNILMHKKIGGRTTYYCPRHQKM